MLTSTETTKDRFPSATLDTPGVHAVPLTDDLTAVSVPALPREPAINSMFRRMHELKSSDLHLSATMPPLIRKDGEMRPLHDAAGPLSSEMIVRLLGEIMPSINKAEYEARHDTDFAYEITGLARFRANVFKDRHGMGAVFRVIPAEILTAEQLGLSAHVLALCQLTKGLVLVTGPTGSGQIDDARAMIDHINKTRADHIITIEDPIEFVHQNKKCLINQREVHTHTRSFKDALRAALREDPDIVLVGELRDLETIAIAIETAETGHLVFGTLHTTTAASTVDRIIDQFPADRQEQIRVMLVGVAARRHRADALQEDRRRARRGARDPAHQRRDQQPDSRRQDVPDPVDDAGRPRARHDRAERRARRPGQEGADHGRRGDEPVGRQGRDVGPDQARPAGRRLNRSTAATTGTRITSSRTSARRL